MISKRPRQKRKTKSRPFSREGLSALETVQDDVGGIAGMCRRIVSVSRVSGIDWICSVRS
jgi:hypothetical protein